MSFVYFYLVTFIFIGFILRKCSDTIYYNCLYLSVSVFQCHLPLFLSSLHTQALPFTIIRSTLSPLPPRQDSRSRVLSMEAATRPPAPFSMLSTKRQPLQPRPSIWETHHSSRCTPWHPPRLPWTPAPTLSLLKPVSPPLSRLSTSTPSRCSMGITLTIWLMCSRLVFVS